MAEREEPTSLGDQLGLGGLKQAVGDYASSVVSSNLGKVGEKVEGLTGKLNDFSEGKPLGLKEKAITEGIKAKLSGKNPAVGAMGGVLGGVKDKVVDVFTGGRRGQGSHKQKFANFVESFDVGVPVRVAYNQWTEFDQWSDFMKKVHNVEHNADEGKVGFKGQVFWSHRSWDSTIKEMVPDDKIIWKSKGQKGHLDGAVTFHELGPRLTRIVIVIEYYPRGFMEKTANIWRAAGRRIRLELKLYVRHVMTTTILDPDRIEGWRGEIRDGKVIRTHEQALEEERQAKEEAQDEGAESVGEEPESEYDETDDTGEGDEDYGEEPESEYDETDDTGEGDEDYGEGDEGDEADDEPEADYDEDVDDEADLEYEPDVTDDEAFDDEAAESDDEPVRNRR